MSWQQELDFLRDLDIYKNKSEGLDLASSWYGWIRYPQSRPWSKSKV